VIEPDDACPCGRALGDLADRWGGRFVQVLKAIAHFALEAHMRAVRTAPGDPQLRDNPDPGLDVEVFIVPRIYEDASVLLRVDHRVRTIRFVAVYADYGGYDEHVQWKEIIELSIKALDPQWDG
jgi:hypothetical protein